VRGVAPRVADAAARGPHLGEDALDVDLRLVARADTHRLVGGCRSLTFVPPARIVRCWHVGREHGAGAIAARPRPRSDNVTEERSGH
jgi:hypothetical protein